MSEFNRNENKSNDITDSYEETIEDAIMSKVKQFFDLNKKLKHSQLNIFLHSINLSDVFGEDEEKEIIWNIFSRLSSNKEEIDYEICRTGMKELFLFYGITGDDTENIKENYNQHESLDQINTHCTTEDKIFITTPLKTTLTNSHDPINNKDRKFDELLYRISIKNTPDKFQKFNTPYLESELNNRKDSQENNVTNRFELKNKINDLDGEVTLVRKRSLERKITKTFTEIDIEKLQQLRKVFTILDLRNKENVYISEIQDVIRKYKFIKLTTDELVNFLRLISDDIMKSGENNQQKFSINFELYSRAISAIEQQLLQVNSDTFEEKNDSYELTENFVELIEELNKMEFETIDHIIVLAEIIKSSDLRVEGSLCENYEKLLKKNFSVKENECIVKNNIQEDLIVFHNKIKDAQLFLQEINQVSLKKQSKLSSLKNTILKLENNLKLAEEDLRCMFEKVNMNQPMEIDDETERLFEENSYLNDQKILKENKILALQKELNEKQEQIFILDNKLEKLKTIENENKTSYLNLKKEFEILENNYKFLVNDIYEKIDKEETKEVTNSKNNYNSSKTSHINESENTQKIKENLSKNELTKKFVEMNYDQLLIYTLNTESLSTQLEEKNSQKDQRIKVLEKELNEIKNLAGENSRSVIQLKTDNIRLQEKINEMNKEIEMNNMFRPSRVLNNRISKIGDTRDRYSNTNLNTSVISTNAYTGRFNKMQKLFELDIKQNDVNKNTIKINDDEASFTNVRISKIDFDEADTGINIKKQPEDFSLKIETQTAINTVNIDNKNRNLDKQNLITYEDRDSRFNNHFTFSNFPEKQKESVRNTTNRISNNALEISSFTNGNMEIFSQADPFASNDNYLFEDRGNDGDKESTIDNKLHEGNSRLKYSFRPEDDYYLYKNDNDQIGRASHNIIIDYLEENPFPSKDNEEDNRDEACVKHDLDTSVNWNKIAKHSLIDVDMQEIKKNREKLKQSITRQNTIESTSTAIIYNKMNKRLPSLITEEILEEDINGDIIGTPIKTEAKSVSGSGNRISTEENFTGYHSRMNTMDLDLVFNKDSQYVCYDFLTLRKNMGIINMLENNSEDVSSYEMFSDNVFLIDEYNKKSKKYLFITSKIKNLIYLRQFHLHSKTIRCDIKDKTELKTSHKIDNLE